MAKWIPFKDCPVGWVFVDITNTKYFKSGSNSAIELGTSMDEFFPSSILVIPIDINVFLDKFYYIDTNHDKMCYCGHEYHRHFDGYDDNRYIGCKYCECNDIRLKE